MAIDPVGSHTDFESDPTLGKRFHVVPIDDVITTLHQVTSRQDIFTRLQIVVRGTFCALASVRENRLWDTLAVNE
jgi:hypothetical protein